MKKKINFNELGDINKKSLLDSYFNRGQCILHTSGLCGEIFVFDQGVNTSPRYSCIKVPKPIKDVSNEETARRFIRELELQLSFFHNRFVHWAFDFDSVLDTPVASFRYWGNDLANLIKTSQPSQITKFSLLVYTCVGLRHCYEKGLIAHQDLKPANIFIQNIKNDFVGLPDLDIYDFAIVADFGLANAFIDYNLFDGSRPYMAPEQWNKNELSHATDVFALGVIFFELVTNGYHPIGIKLSDFWPIPQNGNTKKYTRPDSWKKWIEDGCKVELQEGISVDGNIIDFIKKMLSIQPSHRPSINEVVNFLLEQINEISTESYFHLNCINNDFDKLSFDFTDLRTDWPYLFMKWEKFKKHFQENNANS